MYVFIVFRLSAHYNLFDVIAHFVHLFLNISLVSLLKLYFILFYFMYLLIPIATILGLNC